MTSVRIPDQRQLEPHPCAALSIALFIADSGMSVAIGKDRHPTEKRPCNGFVNNTSGGIQILGESCSHFPEEV